MFEKFELRCFPTVKLCYDYLYNHNDIDEKTINYIIDFVCQSDVESIFHFIKSSDKLKLNKYNISSLVHALVENNDIDSTCETFNLSNIRRCDREFIISYVCNNYDIENIEYFITHAKNLESADYYLLSNCIAKSKDPIIIYNFTSRAIDKLSFSDITKLTYAMCATKSVKYIIEFSKLDIKENFDIVVGTMCSISTLGDLIRFTKELEIKEEYNVHKITHEFSREDRINQKDIRTYISVCNNLTKEDYSELTIAMLKTKDIKSIIAYSSECDKLSEEDLTRITKYICNNGSSKDIYTFASTVNLSSHNITLLAEELLIKEDVKYMYLFLKDVNNINSKTRKELIDKIVVSKQMKYICLVIAFIDITLLHKLFSSISEYILCINSLGYTKEELSSIYHKIFDIEPNEIVINKTKEKVEKLVLTIE